MIKYDLLRIGKGVEDIERFFLSLERLSIQNIKELEEEKTFYATSMILFTILNRSIDLGEELISAYHLALPSSYKDIFFLLEKGKIISVKQAKALSALMHSRNLLAHEYRDFTAKDVFEIVRKIDVVKEFVATIKKLVAQSSEK